MRWGTIFVVLVATLAFAASTQAHPGDLDESFGTGGIFATHVGPDYFGGLAVGDDGRAFYLSFHVGGATLVAVSNSGEIDSSFGAGGEVNLDSLVAADEVVVSPSGKVLVSGVDPTETSYYAQDTIVRLTRDGQVDPTFGTEGVLQLPLDYHGFIGDMGFDDNGRLVVLTNGDSGARLIRLTDSGDYDTSFGDDGESPVGVSRYARFGVSQYARSLLFGPDGSMFIVGAPLSFDIAKYTSAGQLDTSYGQAGKVSIDVGMDVVVGDDYTVDPQGRLSYVRMHLLPPFATAGKLYSIGRLTTSGEPDQTFEPAPELMGPTADGDAIQLYGILADDQGRLLLSGSFGDYTSEETEPLIARLLPDGSLDPDFGEGGVSMFPLDYSDFPFSYFGELLPAGPDRVMSSGVGFLSRIELDNAPADADADSVRDRRDGCSRRYSEHRDGCGRIPVNLTLDDNAGGRRISGRIRTAEPCLSRGKRKPAQVWVFAAGKGDDERLGRARVDRRGRWSFRVPPEHGKVYAAYPAHRARDIAVCRGAKSKTAEG